MTATSLRRGDQGPAVVDLQLRLAAFRGTLWDGDFGPGTELQVVSFQRDFMGLTSPSGKADKLIAAKKAIVYKPKADTAHVVAED